jgi:DNA-binding HxlR family transcriptional regulator
MEPPETEPDRVPPCPLTAAASAIGGKWKLIILWWLKDEPRHFGELRRLMPRISHKVLSQQLRELQGDGLILRDVQDDALRHVQYSLTAHGETVRPLLEKIRGWGMDHARQRDRSSASDDDRSADPS